MQTLTQNFKSEDRTRNAASASQVMTPNPLSINQNATVAEAAEFLTKNGFSAAPVIDDAGRAVGVLSRSDIVRYARDQEHDWFGQPIIIAREIMNPDVLFVRLDTPIGTVIDDLLECQIHRLFVADDDGVLVGVISTLDVLRFLQGCAQLKRGT